MSYSRVFRDRLFERLWRRRVSAFIYIAAMVAYIAWRATIINHDALILSSIYFAAEIIGFVLGLTMIFCSWSYLHREPKPVPANFTVDVFVPVYREPVELVRWTLLAAKEISLPHQTFLLDDGNRPEMKALAGELGIRYLARERNINAKAGNLNNGLPHSTAEYLMVFDADHIAVPHALEVTLGFFADENVALVQTPQDFYNIDAFQYFNPRRSRGLWHDQSFFYGLAEPSRAAVNGASCIGTGVVYRRSALDTIGGFPTETVTEDMHTSLRLHALGYEVVYLNEPTAYGVAASDLRDYYNTRHRWAHGNLHVLRIENIFGRGRFTLAQRFSYLSLGLIYLEGWQQLLLFLVPIASLLLGWAPFEITVFNVLVVLLFPVVTTLLLQELGCGLARPWVNEIYSMARFPVHIAAWAALFINRMPFRTSSKRIRGHVEWKLMLPQLSVLILSMIAFATGVINLALNFKIGPLAYAVSDIFSGHVSNVNWTQRLDQGYTLELVAVSGFWAIFNATKAFYFIRKSILDARNSTEDYRFESHLILEVDTGLGTRLGRVQKISRNWMSVRFADGPHMNAGNRIRGRLHLPTGPIMIDGEVTRTPSAKSKVINLGRHSIEITKGRADDEDACLECNLDWPDRRASDSLMRTLYAVDWHREFTHRAAFFSTPIDVLQRLLRLRRPFAVDGPVWWPALYRDTAVGDQLYAVVGIHPRGDKVTVIAFRAIYPETVLDMDLVTDRGVERRTIKISAPETLLHLGQKGLDGSQVRKFRGEIVAKASLAAEVLPVAAE